MAEELQGLLNRLHEKGVLEAEAEKEKLIASAKEESEKIIKDAKNEAEAIIKKGKEESVKSEERAKSAIKQASRDVVLSLKEVLQTRLDNLIKNNIAEAMTPDQMGKILVEMVGNYVKNNPEKDPGIEVILAKKDLEEMEKAFKGSLKKSLKSEPNIILGHDFAAGLKVGFKGEDVFFDFTDDAISDILVSFLGPKFAEFFKD
ncbi:hypothetical protein KAJ27_01595 [bacterium]|nr:hypothetical protein [bacterium]